MVWNRIRFFLTTMMIFLALGLFLVISLSSTATTVSGAETEESPPPEKVGGITGVLPEVDRILREMGEYLSAAQEFSFQADISYDTVTLDGQKILFGGIANISKRRPDRLRVEYNGDERHTRVLYNGQTFTMYNTKDRLYAVTDVPSQIDRALDLVFEVYGFSVPIADLVYSDPYQTLIENVETGFLVGQHWVDGTRCHHLAFSQEAIDWQIWIEDGPQPVPRKLLITYKSEPGSPQYIARLSAWKFHPRFSTHYFEFHPPAGAGEIEFLPVPLEEVEP